MFLHDKLGFLDRCARTSGAVTELRIGGPTVLLKEPDDIRFVLEERPDAFDKHRKLTGERGLRLSGRGLLTSSGARHRFLREALQPLFTRSALRVHTGTLAATTVSFMAGWKNHSVLDLREEMPRLARWIVARILFGAEYAEKTALTDAFLVRKSYLQFRFDVPSAWPEWLPLPLEIRYRTAMKTIRDSLRTRIACEADRADHTSLIGQMLQAGLTGEEFYHEALTFAITGYETLGEMLTWTLSLLAAHSAEQRRVREEARRVLTGDVPSTADVLELPCTSRVLMESMRLFPPTWLFLWTAVAETTLPSGYRMREGTKVYLSPWVVHRDSRYYPEPARFLPDRFLAAEVARRPKLSYFPFGAGPRLCIGHHLAKIEATLVLGILLRDMEFQRGARPPVTPSPRMTLRPSRPVWADVSRVSS